MKNYNQYDDRQLIALLNEDAPASEQAFRALYSRYSDKLHAYCLFKSDRHEDAEEIFTETWIRFHKSAKSGKQIENPQAFLYTVARNLSYNMYRSNKSRMIQNIQSVDFERIANPLNLNLDIENVELLSLISAAVNNLKDIYKETFVLIWFSGFSYSEIAEIVGETAGCVRKRSTRAMEEVIKMLKPIIKELSE
ncbi:MAG: RNA polymerase sigma factor [Candidatus Kapabacteria bacterium]|jgi:RNA polymerase sigma-70 factor (ECF subfamily)|nr:RNA polymerase sigma factor [Candidatus Kapabacteria bacterium]